ncbi:hypothetical protein L1987_20428 [Smallanthus sonchifolius]|uniref:Uncharacterized protein n=1 Tax=Smallanthus sonchifolius TaxID=185202 RepID=A0ACB9ITI3_9ASTR|nr:hypothetical protein L1987_20428 [Smallanthus sonchifolius]
MNCASLRDVESNIKTQILEAIMAGISLENYMPPVTFIVVQNRHHTRFFPDRHGEKNTIDRSGNILPGL